jgi:hypothetical protein
VHVILQTRARKIYNADSLAVGGIKVMTQTFVWTSKCTPTSTILLPMVLAVVIPLKKIPRLVFVFTVNVGKMFVERLAAIIVALVFAFPILPFSANAMLPTLVHNASS